MKRQSRHWSTEGSVLQNQIDVTCYRAFILPHCGLEKPHVISGRTATEHFGRFATKHSGSGIAGTPTKLAGDTAAEHVAGSATEHAIQHLLTFCSGNAEPC